MNANSNCKSKDWFQANGYTLITPEVATQWLTKNIRNRSIRESFVNNLVKKIKMGQWQPNTLDAIGFYEDGTLANGQHRLTAIAKAGLPVYAKVEYNVPMDAAVCIDSGKARTANDAVRIVTGETYYTPNISRMVNIVATAKNLTHEDHLKIATRYRDQIIKIKEMFEGLPKALQTTSTMAAVFTALMDGVDEDALHQFVGLFHTPLARTEAEVTVVAFADRLKNEHASWNSRQRRDYTYEIKRCQNVIYNFVRGKSIKNFKVPENFRYPLIKFNVD